MAAAFSYSFVIDIGTLTVAALLFSLLLSRFRLPEVSGQIIAGIIVGPYMLGIVSNLAVITALSQLGIILLMFIIGLELDPKEMRNLLSRIGSISFIEVGTSFLIVFTASFLLLGQLSAALVVAVALSFTSTAIVGRLIIDRQHGQSAGAAGQAGKTLLGVLVVEDVIAVAFLVLIPGLPDGASGSALHSLPLIVGGGFAFLALTYLSGRFIIPRILEYVESRQLSSGDVPFLLSLALGIIFGAAATYLGFSPAIGSFLIGLALGGKYSEFVSRQVKSLHTLFVTLFFVSIGASIDPISALSSPLVLAAIIAAALGSKYLGGFFAGRMISTGLKPGLLGLWLLPRAEFSLVIVQSALSASIIGEDLYSVVGITVMVTSLAGPLLLVSSGRRGSRPAG